MSTDSTPRRTSDGLDWRSNPDLVAVTAYAVVAAPILALGGWLPAAVRIPIALPLLVFVPGYAVVASLVPSRRNAASGGESRGAGGIDAGLSRLERLTLAIVASVALVPMVALVANAVVGVTLGPVLAGLVGLTASAAAVAASRRPTGDGTDRDPLAVGDENGAGTPRPDGRVTRGDGRSAASPLDAVTLAAVAVAAVLLATSAVVAFSDAPTSDAATEFYLVNDTEDGQFVGGDYPRTLEAGETRAFALGIEHGDTATREYTVVARLEPVDWAANATRVRSATELRRITTTVGPDEPAVRPYRVSVSNASEDRRLTFLLYRGGAPTAPDRRSAHRVVSLPVDVVAADG